MDASGRLRERNVREKTIKGHASPDSIPRRETGEKRTDRLRRTRTTPRGNAGKQQEYHNFPGHAP
ncbi:Hypothetical predicted protein, partial [Podarcis lilfordi]